MKLRTTKKLFGWLFSISSSIFLFLWVYLLYYDTRLFWNEKKYLSIDISIIALLTSLTSLIGFLSTTIISWRKEHRESSYEKLEMEKRKLEIEKLKKELNKTDAINK